LDGNVGETINLEEILICGEGDSIKIGTPYVEGCSVACEVTEQLRGKKIIVFKKKRRKGYRRKNGHRQDFSLIHIDSISASASKKKAAPKKVAAKKKTTKAEKKEN